MFRGWLGAADVLGQLTLGDNPSFPRLLPELQPLSRARAFGQTPAAGTPSNAPVLVFSHGERKPVLQCKQVI